MNQVTQPTISVRITMKARSGKAHELEELLLKGAQIVAETEPNTLYWYSTKIDEYTFTINDGFMSEQGMQEHYAGTVANLLKQRSEDLIEGGWSNGVLKNIEQSKIISISDRES